MRVRPPHDHDRGADDDERHERPDVHQVGEDLEGEERRHRRHEHASQDRRLVRGPEDRVDRREERTRDQPVACHGEEDAGLAQQEHEENARDPDDRTERDEEHGDRKPPDRERPRHGGVEVDLVVRDHAGQHGRHQDVEDRAEPERGDDGDRYVALRIAGLLGVGRDGIEANVGEEDVGRALEDAGDTVGEEGVPVLRLDVAGPEADHEEDDHELEAHHRGVEARALADADDQHDGDEEHDEGGWQVADRAGVHPGVGAGVEVDRCPRPASGQGHAEEPEERDEVVRPAVRHGARGDRVLEDQVPADDPGEELAERGVGVGVGAARHRHHRRKLAVAERGERTAESRDAEGEDEAGSGIDVGGEPGQHEDAGADDRADAERRERDGTEDPPQTLLTG